MTGLRKVTLGMLQKANKVALKRKIEAREEQKLQKLCQQTARSIAYPKPINFSVNNSSTFSFNDIDINCMDSQWAPWSNVYKMQQKLNVLS